MENTYWKTLLENQTNDKLVCWNIQKVDTSISNIQEHLLGLTDHTWQPYSLHLTLRIISYDVAGLSLNDYNSAAASRVPNPRK